MKTPRIVAVRGIRVYALARDLAVSPQAVLDAARRLGYNVPNMLITLDPDQRAAVAKLLGREPPDEPTGVPSRLRPRGPGPLEGRADA